MTRDVVERLVDSRAESTEVRSLLEAGISDDVGDYDFEHGLEKHMAAIGAVPGAGGTAPAGSGPMGHSSAGAASAKTLALAIGIPLASLSAIAAVVLLGTPRPPSGAPAHPAAQTATAMVELANPEANMGANQAAHSPSPAVAANNEEAAPPDEKGATVPVETRRHAGVRSEKLTLAEDAPAAPPQASGTEHTDRRSEIVRDMPNDRARPTRSDPAPSAGPVVVAKEEPRPSDEEVLRAERARDEARHDAEDKFQREMEELMQAKRALSSDPKRSLELAERGQREFKQSLLSEEREHVLLLALIALGRVSEAERRAEPYLAQHPDSPFARRVRAAIEASKSRKAH